MDVEDGPSIFHAHEGLGLDLTWEREEGRGGEKELGFKKKRVSQSVIQSVPTVVACQQCKKKTMRDLL